MTTARMSTGGKEPRKAKIDPPKAKKGGAADNQKACFNEVLDSSIHATALIQRAERTALESFILTHVSPDLIIENFGTTENKKLIEQRLGISAKVEIQEVALRTGAHSGSFDSINDETLIYILNFLSTHDRLKAVLFISQSWYSMRNAAELWRNLTIGQSCRDYDSLDCSSLVLSRLSQRLNLSQMTDLTCRKGCADVNAWKLFLKSLSHPLTSLTISAIVNKTNKLLQSFGDLDLTKVGHSRRLSHHYYWNGPY